MCQSNNPMEGVINFEHRKNCPVGRYRGALGRDDFGKSTQLFSVLHVYPAECVMPLSGPAD